MGKGLAKAGAIIALVGGAIGSLGAASFVLMILYVYVWRTVGPDWVAVLSPLFGVGVAIFSVGASLALWGLASGLPS